MKTDIESAQAAEMLPIGQVAHKAGVSEELLEYYGRYKAKIDITPLRDKARKGKLILVTAINPVSYTHLDVYKRQGVSRVTGQG